MTASKTDWVVTPEPTLPVHVALAPAHRPACTMGPTSLDRCRKTWAAHTLSVTGRAVVYDRGREAYGISRLRQAITITPVLALPPRRGQPPAPTGAAPQGNDHGVPLCPAGRPMRRHRE